MVAFLPTAPHFLMKLLWWKIKFYWKRQFVNDGVERRKDPKVIDTPLAPEYKLYFDGEGIYTEAELVERHNTTSQS